jgi:hypothetical protein
MNRRVSRDVRILIVLVRVTELDAGSRPRATPGER